MTTSRKQVISIRIDKGILEQMRRFVSENRPHVASLTQLIEVAVSEYLARNE